MKSHKVKRVLITGASGFLGKNLISSFKKENVEITVVVRNLRFSWLKKNTIIKKIITTENIFNHDYEWWKETLHNIDIVIHCAWFVEPGKYLNSEKNIECLNGSIPLAKAAVYNNIEKFIGIGSCFEYNLDLGTLDINSELKPQNLYASSKVALFHILNSIFRQSQVKFAWCRLFYLFGEGENENRLFPYVRKQLLLNKPVLLTSGNQVRDYMDVKDAAKLIINTSFSELCGPVNICSGKGITIREFVKNIAKEFGNYELLKFGERHDNLLDPDYVVGIPTIKL